MSRDQVRKDLRSIGVTKQINGSDYVTLADGSTYNIGLDGNANREISTGPSDFYKPKDGSNSKYLPGHQRIPVYEIDKNNPLETSLYNYAKPYAQAVTGGNGKLADNFAGYFTNAALSNTQDPEKAKQNLAAIFKNAGLHRHDLVSTLSELANQGHITKAELADYKAKLKEMIPAAPYTPAPEESSAPKTYGIPSVSQMLPGASSMTIDKYIPSNYFKT